MLARSQVLNLLLAGDISLPVGPLHSSDHVSTDTFLQSKQNEIEIQVRSYSLSVIQAQK